MSDSAPSNKELSKLRWQCRRGVKELDVVLGRYLENQYLHADTQEQHIFQLILEIEDPLLLSCLFDEEQLDIPELSSFIEKLRSYT